MCCWKAVWGHPCEAIHARVRPSHLAVCPQIAAMTMRNTEEETLPVPLRDHLNLSPLQLKLGGNWSSRTYYLLRAKRLFRHQTWLAYTTIVCQMPPVWEISGSYSVYQTWHQAAITQLKHFIFHDNFISLPDFQTFFHFIENSWFACWQIKRCS